MPSIQWKQIPQPLSFQNQEGILYPSEGQIQIIYLSPKGTYEVDSKISIRLLEITLTIREKNSYSTK